MNVIDKVFQQRIGCIVCDATVVADTASAICTGCEERSDLVGDIVWKMVGEAAREAQGRVTFMLAGFSPAFLDGIVRRHPRQGIGGRNLALRINAALAEDLPIDPDLVTTESAVHWRHYDGAGVVVFAPSDEERDSIGAGLGPLTRLDSEAVISRYGDWADVFNETETGREYVRRLLVGLHRSGICVDLQMWVEFVHALKALGYEGEVADRAQRAVPALQIPLRGLRKLPKVPASDKPQPDTARFESAFRNAKDEVGVFAYLTNRKAEPVDIEAVSARLDELLAEHIDDDDLQAAAPAIRALLKAQHQVRPGSWLPSQQDFCEQVPWDLVGERVFVGKGQKVTDSLGERTLQFITDDYNDDITDEEKALLAKLNDKASTMPSEEEQAFFERWQDRLSRKEAGNLYRQWHKRLFRKEIIAHDLLSALVDGLEALFAIAEDGTRDMVSPTLVIRPEKHDKLHAFWNQLDRRVLRLFAFETRCLSGVLGENVVLDLGKCYDAKEAEKQSSGSARSIGLEMYLVDRGEEGTTATDASLLKRAPRVKVLWQPGRSASDSPIGLALPEDIESLANEAAHAGRVTALQRFSPKTHLAQGSSETVTLANTTSFNDVGASQEGRTFDTAASFEENLLDEVARHIAAMRRFGSIEEDDACALELALQRFRFCFAEAVTALYNNPGMAMRGDVLMKQAMAFGELCHVARVHADTDTGRTEIWSRLAKVGIVPAVEGDKGAILAAWHPLRLAERRARMREFATMVENMLVPGREASQFLGVSFEERRQCLSRWFFPEVAILDGETLMAVESVDGYSFLVPVGCVATSRAALEQSAGHAAERFIAGVEEYLAVHPHEASNLSAAVYNAESLTLPQEIARGMTKFIRRDPDLRCDLLITHNNGSRMRQIYEDQNTRLAAENINDTAKGFLSRLRVGVESTSNDNVGHAVRDLDLVFLHDVVNEYAENDWDHESGAAASFDEDFDLRVAVRPRRRLGEIGAGSTGIYLTLPQPPRAVAHYYDLLYTLSKKAVIPSGMHAVLVRSIRFENAEVRRTVERAHELAEWVVSYDHISSRQVLEACGAKIIRDVSVPGLDARVIISSASASRALRERLGNEIMRFAGVDAERAASICETVLERVVEISGQKILAGARFTNATREMIGLSAARAVVEAVSPAESEPIWISLDDYRSWLSAAKGKIADLVAVSVVDHGTDFEIVLVVAEAKFVSAANVQKESQEALKQVRDTADRLQAIFIDNEDPMAHASWCARMAELLVTRDGLAQRLGDPEQRARFFEAMASGDVRFRLSGDAVVCLHDDAECGHQLILEAEHPHLRLHKLSVSAIMRALDTLSTGGRLMLEEDVLWVPETITSTIPADVGRERHGQTCPTDGPFTAEDNAEPEHGAAVLTPRHREPKEPTSDEPPLLLSDKDRVCSTEPEPAAVRMAGRTAVALDPSDADGDALREAAQVYPDLCDADVGNEACSGAMPRPVFDALARVRDGEESAADDAEILAWAEEKASAMQRAFSDFKMHAAFADPKVRLTPNGALVSFRGHATLTVEKIERKRSELLTTHEIDVVDIRPEPGRISVFVRRPKRAKVPLATTWLSADWPDRASGQMTNFVVGVREDDGRLLYLNLAGSFAGYEEHGPHTLIAGETGSGKGVLTQSLLLQLIAFNAPSEVELILIDPKKGVDFAWIEDAPHMRRPMITDAEPARAVFSELTKEMDERYELIRSRGATNIAEYNARVDASARLPRIFLVHDEMGAWMADAEGYQDTVLGAVSNLGMKARAAGFHIVLITQRADVHAVPGRLRDNMNNRLCLKVQNQKGSEMILNCTGGERLLGRGHLAARLSGDNPPPGQNFFVAQVPFAPTPDVAAIARAAIDHWRSMSG